VERLEKLRRELRAEIVPYTKGGAVVRQADVKTFTVRVQRPSGPAQARDRVPPPGGGAQPSDGAQRPSA
jgi:hypothetical protein